MPINRKIENSQCTSFKLFKACQFCRHRKMKCVLRPGERICEKCKQHKKKCVFNFKQIKTNGMSEVRTNLTVRVGHDEVKWLEGHQHKDKASEPETRNKNTNIHLSFQNTDESDFIGKNSAQNTMDNLARLKGGKSKQINPLDKSNTKSISVRIESETKNDTTLNIKASREISAPIHQNRIDPQGSKPESLKYILRGDVLPSPPSPERESCLEYEQKEGDDEPSLSLFDMVPNLFKQWNVFNNSQSTKRTVSEAFLIQKPVEENLLKLYRTKIEPETPFLPNTDKHTHEFDFFCKWCIDICSTDSPQTTINISANTVEGMINNEIKWTAESLGCFFILPLHIFVSNNAMVKVYENLNSWMKISQRNQNKMDPKLIAGAMLVDGINALTRGMHLQTNRTYSNAFQMCSQKLGEFSFSNQLLTVGKMIYDFVSMMAESDLCTDQKQFWALRKKKILSFEYDMLIWPVKLSTELSVITDNIQASSEALLLHILHNTLLIAYYGDAVLKNGEFAKSISVYAIPGLYLFISGMAKSNFITGPRIAKRWRVVTDCLILSARYLLALDQKMKFDNFKEALHYFAKGRNLPEYQTPELKDLFKQIDQLLLGVDIEESIQDGSTIYWVFRDTRSMSLELYISE